MAPRIGEAGSGMLPDTVAVLSTTPMTADPASEDLSDTPSQ
jgi:hypothetical protein